MSCTAEELPQEVWAQILQHIPSDQRLSACALVCQKLARAAAAATQSLKLGFNSPQRHDAFLGWVSSHGRSLTCLDLWSSPDCTSIRQLACPNLVELGLHDCGVQLCAGSEGMGLLHTCPALTRLHLHGFTLLDGSVAGPAGTTARLPSFTLSGGRLHGGSEGERKAAQALQDRLLPQLTSLTCLDLRDSNDQLQSCFLQHVSSMVWLKQLSLDAGPIDAATLPGIEHLTALEDLELYDCDLEPSCLLPITTGLRKFTLEQVALETSQAQDGVSGASQLLPRLTELRELELDNIDCEWPQQLAAYSALTASSDLQALGIHTSMPGAVWAHVFPAGRKLPHLRFFCSVHSLDFDVEVQQSCALSADTVARLCSCCPGLQHLSFISPRGGAEDEEEAACLAPLRCLTALSSLWGYYMNPTAYASLAALTQLKDLMLKPVAADGDDSEGAAADRAEHLLPLSALTGLTTLGIYHEQDIDQWALAWRNRAPKDSPPDVWVQLLEYCARDPTAQPAVISSMLRQLQQQREQGAQQVAQQQRQQEQANQQAAQLQQQQDDIAELRQQHTQELAAASAEAAELRGRVQVWEEQLQEVLAALRQQPRHA